MANLIPDVLEAHPHEVGFGMDARLQIAGGSQDFGMLEVDVLTWG
jgi:hypothetical protein